MSHAPTTRTRKVFLRDVTERVVMTFVEGTLGSFVITQYADKQMWLAAVGGGVAAIASLLKSLGASGVGNPQSASLSGDV